jgi:hypothetical protein
MHPTQGQPQVLSNEIEDFQAGGGLYPGGTGIIEEFCYCLWDYDGKRPKDSTCAARLRLRPIDGSNEGKVVEQYYSVGASTDYLPDNTGGNVISLRGKAFMDSTNWGHFLKTLRNGCGLEKGKLSSPIGIRAMQQGVMTVVKAEQPHREGLDDLPATPADKDKKKYPRTMLLPTRAVFTWDPNYASATRNIPPPPQSGQSVPTQTPPPLHYQAPANGAAVQQVGGVATVTPMASNPANGDYSLAGVIRSLLAKNGGSLSIAGGPNGTPPPIASQVITELGTNVTREMRIAMSKESKDMAVLTQLAAVNGWTLAGDDLIA